MAGGTIRVALLASLVAVAATGCTNMNARHETSGTNDGIKTNNYRYYRSNGTDMRLGFDRYKSNNPNMFRDSDSLRHGLNRDNGITGYSADGVNRWSDYKGMDGTPGATMPGTQTPQTTTSGLHNNTRMEAAQDVANQLTTIDPVQSCNVMLTDRNAYVAVKTKNGQNLDDSANVKEQIANQVKSMRPTVQNVYVSENPDFVGRVSRYAQDLGAGKPVSGFVDEFNTMVQRLFPTNAAAPHAPATR